MSMVSAYAHKDGWFYFLSTILFPPFFFCDWFSGYRYASLTQTAIREAFFVIGVRFFALIFVTEA